MSNLELLQEMYDAFDRGDLDAVLAKCDPNVAWYEAESNPVQPDGQPWVGADAVIDGLRRVASEWDGFTVVRTRMADAGDVALVECRYQGVGKVTGRSLDVQACHVWTLHKGTPVVFHQYLDTAAYIEALGQPVATR